MPRDYVRKPGSRKYKDYDEEDLRKAVYAVKNGEMSSRDAESIYGIPRRTILNKVNDKHSLSVGAPKIYSDEEEDMFEKTVLTLCDWGFPVSVLDLKRIVQAYNDKRHRLVSVFTNNTPGNDWIHRFLRDHPMLVQRFANNIKRVRASVSKDILLGFYDNLKISLDGLLADQIFNYDETAFMDDPGKKRVLARRGTKYVDQILNTTKTTVSIMFCGSASGILLPPYICYKSQNLWNEWLRHRPKGPPFCECRSCRHGVRINRSSHGLFDAIVFGDWFKQVFLPHANRIHGRKALIGDNLSSHFTEEALNLAQENDILFICLPPNSTHLTQPLDVAFFRPTKNQWRKILLASKLANPRSSGLDKVIFPKLLGEVFQNSELEGRVGEILTAGFEKSAIFPNDPHPVLNRIPSTADSSLSSSASSSALSDVVLDRLSNLRYGQDDNQSKRRGKKLAVPPGLSVAHFSIDHEDEASTSGINSHERSNHIDESIAAILADIQIPENEFLESDDDDGEDEF